MIEMAVEVVVCRLLREALGVLACPHLGQGWGEGEGEGEGEDCRGQLRVIEPPRPLPGHP